MPLCLSQACIIGPRGIVASSVQDLGSVLTLVLCLKLVTQAQDAVWESHCQRWFWRHGKHSGLCDVSPHLLLTQLSQQGFARLYQVPTPPHLPVNALHVTHPQNHHTQGSKQHSTLIA